MADDDLLPGDPPSPVPPTPGARRSSTIVCEMCRCVLTPTGDYLSLSEEAKEFRKQKETLETLRESLADLRTQITTVTRERDEALALLNPALKERKFALW